MRITDIETTNTPGRARLSARVVWERSRHKPEQLEFLYCDVESCAIVAPGDALLASMLIPAMAMGEDMRIDAPVSATLLESAKKIVRIHRDWYPAWRRIAVDASPIDRSTLQPTESASFFSGGVDSFHTILRPREEPITLLLTTVGFDMRFEKRADAPAVIDRLRRAAERMSLRLVLADSNAYEIGHKYVFEAEHFGGFLAAIALALGGCVRRCFIPAGHRLWRVPPHGSHPAVDPLWSTETLEVIHDGAEYSRLEKVLAIADDDVALATLRVCLRRPDRYNCGRCQKCVFTALALHVAGALDQCSTLGLPDVRTIRRTWIGDPYEGPFRELLDEVREPELRGAIRHSLRIRRLRAPAEPIVRFARRRRLSARITAHEQTLAEGSSS